MAQVKDVVKYPYGREEEADERDAERVQRNAEKDLRRDSLRNKERAANRRMYRRG